LKAVRRKWFIANPFVHEEVRRRLDDAFHPLSLINSDFRVFEAIEAQIGSFHMFLRKRLKGGAKGGGGLFFASIGFAIVTASERVTVCETFSLLRPQWQS
jgi:hypothetical protein